MTRLTSTELQTLRDRLDDKFACAQWDIMILRKWHIRSRKIVTPMQARLLYLYKFAVDTWDETEGAYNYITEDQLTAIFRRVQEIPNC